MDGNGKRCGYPSFSELKENGIFRKDGGELEKRLINQWPHAKRIKWSDHFGLEILILFFWYSFRVICGCIATFSKLNKVPLSIKPKLNHWNLNKLKLKSKFNKVTSVKRVKKLMFLFHLNKLKIVHKSIIRRGERSQLLWMQRLTFDNIFLQNWTHCMCICYPAFW